MLSIKSGGSLSVNSSSSLSISSSGGEPPPMTDMVAWWNAGSITGVSNGGSVNVWQDDSGTGNNLSAYAGGPPTGHVPTYSASNAILNGQPAVMFDKDQVQSLVKGDGDSMGGSYPIGLENIPSQPSGYNQNRSMTVYAVGYSANPSPYGMMFAWGMNGGYGAPNGCRVGIWGTPVGGVQSIGVEHNNYTSGLYANANLTPTLVSWSYTGGTLFAASTQHINGNVGAVQTLAPSGGPIQWPNSGGVQIRMGGIPTYTGSGYCWNGAVAEVLVYSVAHDLITMAQIENYLKTKYGCGNPPPPPPVTNPFCLADTVTPTQLNLSSLTSIGSTTSIRGQLSAASERAVKRGGSYYAQYFVLTNVPAGASYQINMNSDSDSADPPSTGIWDTFLYINNGPCSSDATLVADDDSGPGADSQVTTSLSAGTNYICECTSYSPGTSGYFNLQVTRMS